MSFANELSSRWRRLGKSLAAIGADSIIVSSSEYSDQANVQYLSGFSGSAAVVLANGESCFLIVDSRYYEQAEEEAAVFGVIVLNMEGRNPQSAITKAVSELAAKHLVYEEERTTVAFLKRLSEIGVEAFSTHNTMKVLRSVKSDWEAAKLRRSSRVAAEAFESILPQLHAGMTEAQAATLLSDALRRRGATRLVKGHFVVASGPRGARPHGVFSDRVIREGELVTFDFGGVVEGYVSDMTRTVAFGDPGARMREIYAAVLEANKAAIESLSPKRSPADIERSTRQCLQNRGLAGYMLHVPGHGIGLELHELPLISAGSSESFQPGQVVTIEPGVYVYGLGGVRIEDALLVTEGGNEVLTSASPKELRILT